MVDEACRSLVFEFAIGVECLGQDDHALPGDLVLFEEFAEDHLGLAGRVDIGGIEGLDE